MKYFTLLITTSLFFAFNTMLFAKDINSTIKCKEKQLYLIVKSKQLNLTEDAVVDNTGGYVDIPEESFYLKINTKVYKLQGKVIENNSINTFQTIIKKENIMSLLKNQELLLIQKIDLLENNQTTSEQNITTTDKVKIFLNKTQLDKEYLKCK